MAGEWIKVETCLPGKAEVIRLARLLSVKRDEAIGIVVRFWVWADSNTVDGVVDGVASHDVDAVLSCPGLCRSLESVGWLSIDTDKERITIPKFLRHNGESAKKRALKNERQARWRDSSVDAVVDAHAPPEKRREEKRKTNAFVLPGWIPSDPWKAWLEVRAKNRAPNTPRALQLAVNELDRLRGVGQDPVALLERATMNGWRAIWPLKDQPAAVKVDL